MLETTSYQIQMYDEMRERWMDFCNDVSLLDAQRNVDIFLQRDLQKFKNARPRYRIMKVVQTIQQDIVKEFASLRPEEVESPIDDFEVWELEVYDKPTKQWSGYGSEGAESQEEGLSVMADAIMADSTRRYRVVYWQQTNEVKVVGYYDPD